MNLRIQTLRHRNPNIKDKVFVPMVCIPGKRDRPLLNSFRQKYRARDYGEYVIELWERIFGKEED